jgi:hypothetical protein
MLKVTCQLQLEPREKKLYAIKSSSSSSSQVIWSVWTPGQNKNGGVTITQTFLLFHSQHALA